MAELQKTEKINHHGNELTRRVYIYKAFERFWHWSQALLIMFLIVTGFEVHGSYELMGYKKAIMYHDIAAWACLPLSLTALMAVVKLRGSFMASNTRNTSTPLMAARSTNLSTTSSA